MSGTEAVRDRGRPAPPALAAAEAPVSLAWTPSGFSPSAAPIAATSAADSWLVDDGRVLALERHHRRFADAVAAAGGDGHDALVAAAAAAQHVPALGRWSPRLDLAPDGIRLRIRTPPAPSMRVTAVTAGRDPRTLPQRKGPDLVALAALQAEEVARIGLEAEPIITVGGLVAEGTWSALLWWRGDVLCVPAGSVPLLPSVTAAVLIEIAASEGIEVREERATPAELEGCEVWLANALRGIRAVTSWIDGPRLALPTRAEQWQRELDERRAAPSVSQR
ncbi:aminotransferase class IV [Agrococcus sp. Marseille-P2731]|uniref:aminotransferase class IV n=1 Tax=Agrococcus sp. Marseille-P2731 TaxID=1841862 RepID=UPI0009FA6957|nr:aminotransferase class IV [Agrococcus sp. Marseille-P2731]